MIDVNDYNGVIRIHAGGLQVYIKNELQDEVVSQLATRFPEDENGPIPFEEGATRDELGWECLMFMEQLNIDDFNSAIDEMLPLFIEGSLVGYAWGEKNQQEYQAMFNTFHLAPANEE